jgi:hypothetical protein
MTRQLLGGLALVGTVIVWTSVHVGGQVPTAPVGTTPTEHETWTPPLTADGHPDLTGVYSNATYTPFERPANLGDREFYTPEEAQAIAQRRLDGLPDAHTHYNFEIWMSERDPRGMTSLRTSLLTQPANGRMPPMNAAGQERAAARTAERRLRGPADSAQSRGLSERCLIWQHEGPPIVPTGYYSNLQIHQASGYVIIMHEMMRDARIIPVDGRPHPGPGIRALRGISRGRWEGNTLVIETTNFTDRTNFRGASEHQRVIERLTPIGPETIRYEFVVEDPHTWDVPWGGEYPLVRIPDMLYEYACHEGNYGLGFILSAQRAEDAANAAAGR